MSLGNSQVNLADEDKLKISKVKTDIPKGGKLSKNIVAEAEQVSATKLKPKPKK